MKVLVTGAGGMLGRDVVLAAANAGHDVVGLGRLELDVTSAEALAAKFELERPDVVINCAAWTDVDGAEDAEEEAMAVNGQGAGNVAAAAVAAITIGTLYFGREVFVPIALAILLSFVLAPLVRLLQRWHIPRGLSVISVVFIAFMSIFALGGVIATQVAELAGDLPQYQFTMREKIKSLRGTAATSGTLERAAERLRKLKSRV